MKDTPSHTMRVFDPLLFLIGNRQAILRIAASPWALLVGAILVVSAGIARNYDHLVLTKEPEWIIGPFVASIVTTSFVYICVAAGIGLHHQKSKWNFLTFLSLVWLTAPCAWLYGIPVEQFTDIYTATKYNIAFLAVVSLWRVAIMIRAITVLTETPWQRMSVLVIVPASLEMFFGSIHKGLSLVNIMGGIRIPPHEQLLKNAAEMTTAISFWTFVVGVLLLFFIKGKASQPLARNHGAFPTIAAILASTCTVLWALAAIPHHQKLVNRIQLREMISTKRYQEAVDFASSKQREDFPTHHYLAPEPGGYHYPIEHLRLLNADTPEWLRREWTESALESHSRSHIAIAGDRLNEIKNHHPEILEGLMSHATELEKKERLSWEESMWLETFRENDKAKDQSELKELPYQENETQ